MGQGFFELFVERTMRDPQRIYATFEEKDISFADMERLSQAFCSYLIASGMSSGDVVAIMCRNSPFIPPAIFGIARGGFVWVPVNAELRGEGLAYVVAHSGARLLIYDREFADIVELAIADEPLQSSFSRVELSPEMFVLSETFRRGEPADHVPRPDSIFAIMYTSGTTGRSKGVLVTHQMLRLSGEGVRWLTTPIPGDVYYVWEPLYHIGGAQMLVVPLLEEVSLAVANRFSAGRFWQDVKRYKATHIHYLGGILQMLLKQVEHSEDREHAVRVAWGGGCPSEIWNTFASRFGVEIRECYGLTEASSISTCNLRGVVGSVGQAVPWFSVTIVDENGTVLPQYQRGEIVVTGAIPGATFEGYHRDPEASAKALRDGSLHTGDLGSLDAKGHLWLYGRLTDNLRCRGENVSAWEVERVIASHHLVDDCAVVGVKADFGEQDIKAFIKPIGGAEIDPNQLLSWLVPRLASFQLPRYVTFVTDFNRTPSQRIEKHKLSRALEDSWDRLEGRR